MKISPYHAPESNMLIWMHKIFYGLVCGINDEEEKEEEKRKDNEALVMTYWWQEKYNP